MMVHFAPLLALASASIVAATSLSSRHGTHTKKECPPFPKGDFVIDQYQLYPENMDFDAHRCLLLIGAVFNATVPVYDPYTSTMKTIHEYPGVSHTGTYHIGGVAWDPYTNLYTILTDPGAQWVPDAFGVDVSGTHLLMKYNPDTDKILWTLNISKITNEKYGGFQDVETDPQGNTYVVGTFPGTILRADPKGKAIKPWYLPPPPMPPTTQWGFGGLAQVPNKNILLSVDGDGQLYRFDTRLPKGIPINVPISPNVLYDDTDAIYMPPKYGGKILLISSWASGTQVLRSKDKSWKKAEYLGTVPNPTGPLIDPAAAIGVATVQIGPNTKHGGRIFVVFGIFDFPWVEGTVAGPRRLFPMPDITDKVEALVSKR
ncbi:hypothetical protein QBC37DRAFT_434043 [Rhypophila decipiens]|uniref:Uncharacterized protein n=1 Tax=Rhypophila decipiens TaxID=261697 RepID=A0AAN6XYZ9_9PEZI|nr:hypothetical protein QBC37DRAFT_434043 [Rhypophila decipiens]